MNAVSSNYKELINTSLSLTPKFKIVIDGVEYLSNVIKAYPKISHSNTRFIGGFPAKTLEMEIYDFEDNLDVENKEIEVYKGLVVNGEIEYVKQGVFIAKADNITTNISPKTISLSNVQDRTQLLDDRYESSLDWSTNHTGLEIIQEICTKKGITLSSNTFNFANYSFKQPNFPEGTTNREVISRLAEIGGGIALFNCNGDLTIKAQSTTGDTIQCRKYEKLSKENRFVVNTVVLGKEGIDDDIVYPESVAEERVEFKIYNNPFVDLYREEMIEEVAKYVVGMSYTPYKAENLIDGFIYELNDVVSIADKNGNTFDAVILDISNNSRIKSTIKAETNAETKTNYNLAGSKMSSINEVKLQVDHINNQINSVVSSTETMNKAIDDLESSINYFSVDLSQYNITIPVDSSRKPLETKNYDVNFYGYYKGKQVVPSVAVDNSNAGITTSTTSTYIRFSVDINNIIANLTNNYTLTFTYNSPDGVYKLTKNVVFTLSTQGKDGENGKSAYQIWLEAGNTGSEQDYLNSLKGRDGEDGTNQYFYVRYSANENGNPMTNSPQEDTEYMGTANTTSPTPPTSYSAYTWVKIKGNDGSNGTPGKPGDNGLTPYFHIMYSQDGATFTPEEVDENGNVIYPLGKKPSAWIGQYTDYVEQDSANFDDYEWYKFTEDIDDTLNGMQDDINKNKTDINNNYQDLVGQLDKKANDEELVTIRNSVETLQTNLMAQTKVTEEIVANGVSKVTTTSGTFDKNGLTIEKSGAETKTIVNQVGVNVKDSSDNDALFAGYVDDDKAEDNEKLKAYKGQTIVYSNNMIVDNSLMIGTHSRLEDYEDGTGIFVIG